jgi:hypothetical protein
MEASASAQSLPKHQFLQSTFKVGSRKSDKINYSLTQKVFHSRDVPKDVIESRKEVQKKKQTNVLGTEPQEWNASTIADPKIQKATTTNAESMDLKRQLLKVRAGLMDEKTSKPSKMHSQEHVEDLQRFIVGLTGKGPIGALRGNWVNSVDDRGLAKHCIADHWPDFEPSHCTHNPEDKKAAAAVFQKKEEKRLRMNGNHQKLNKEAYIDPATAISNVNDRLRERKTDFQDLKEQFKRELKVEFPQASEERLQAMAQRLLNEKLLADEKLARFPIQHESFRPNLSLTTQDRRFKEYYHPGTWSWNAAEKRHAYSCCLNFNQDSRGCEYKIVNPDAWCTLGFERSPGQAAAGKM